VSTPFVPQTRTHGTHDDPFGVTDALARAAQRRGGIQAELRRLPPSGDSWVERRRQRLLAAYVFASDAELAR
jgi:hypothetical protein